VSTTYKITGIKRVNLGVPITGAVGTGGITNAATTLPVAAGQGVQFAAASVSNPIRLYAPSTGEVMHVTAVAGTDSLTVSRAQEGTTGVALLAAAVIKHVAKTRFTFANAFNIDPQNQEITFQGDSTQEYVTLNLGMRGTMAADKFVIDVMEKIIGAAPVTTDLPPDEATRYYPQEGNYPNVAAEVDLIAIDDQTGLTAYIRIAVPKMQLYPRPWTPSNAATAAKMGMQLAWTALQTPQDILGAALPSIDPTGDGVHYWMAILA
jgi:hypothetical protein